MVAMQRSGKSGNGRGRDQNRGHDRGDSGTADLAEIFTRVRKGAAGVADYVKDGTRSAAEQVRRTTSEVTRAMADAVKEEAETLYEKQKSKAVSRVASLGKVGKQIGHALHAVKADAIAEYVDSAAERVGDATDYLQEQDLMQLVQDAAKAIRQNQALAVGGLFLASFALTRFLKASESRQQPRQSSGAATDRAGGGGREDEGEDSGESSRE
jgi:hypothetical protein